MQDGCRVHGEHPEHVARASRDEDQLLGAQHRLEARRDDVGGRGESELGEQAGECACIGGAGFAHEHASGRGSHAIARGFSAPSVEGVMRVLARLGAAVARYILTGASFVMRPDDTQSST